MSTSCRAILPLDDEGQVAILHILGIDHERLTCHYAGRDFRLTDVSGVVATDILA